MLARVIRPALVVALLQLALPAAAQAHAGHPEHSNGWLPASPLALAAAALALAGVAVGASLLWRRRGSRDRPLQRLSVGAAALAAVAVIVAGAAWYADRDTEGPAAPSSYGGTALDGVAPDFRLVDQRGEPLTISDLRGRVIVLAFLDPNCTDICPLTAHRFGLVSARLGAAANEVSFLAVNANPDANTVDDVARATGRWQLDGLATWHFLTGSAEDLEPVWRAYFVEAGNPKVAKPGEVAHSPGVYVIDRAGNRRWYVSIPQEALLGAPWDGPAFDDLLVQHIQTLLEE